MLIKDDSGQIMTAGQSTMDQPEAEGGCRKNHAEPKTKLRGCVMNENKAERKVVYAGQDVTLTANV